MVHIAYDCIWHYFAFLYLYSCICIYKSCPISRFLTPVTCTDDHLPPCSDEVRRPLYFEASKQTAICCHLSQCWITMHIFIALIPSICLIFLAYYGSAEAVLVSRILQMHR
ncbi:hypothetical protein C8R42DRAFT_662067 [Lentinula raphanica]|nr:hypothetical protein C8R42DRAFT_662067 [Lentinula raphanica]